MKLSSIKTILSNAQENQLHGNIFTTSGHSVSFDFYFYDGNENADILGFNSETEVISILSAGMNSYIDCDSITHIEVYHKR